MIRVTTQLKDGISSIPHPDHKELTFQFVLNNREDIFYRLKKEWVEKAFYINENRGMQITISYHTQTKLDERIGIIENYFETKLKQVK